MNRWKWISVVQMRLLINRAGRLNESQVQLMINYSKIRCLFSQLVFQRFPVKKSYLDLYWNLTAKIAIEMYTQSLISTSGKRNPHVSRKFLFLSSFIHWLYQTKLQRTTVQMQYLYIHTNDMLRKVIDSARNLLVSQIYLPKKKKRKKEKNRIVSMKEKWWKWKTRREIS